MMRTIFTFLLCVLAGGLRAETFELPADGSDIVGEIRIVTASYDDTLVDIARRSGVGYQDIVSANPGVNIWVPGEGTEVVIPTRYVLPDAPRKGVVLNLAEYRLYYYPEPEGDEPAVVMTYPISIGRQDWETPLGKTRVISKVVNPSWYPPESVRKEHADDGRPLPPIVPPGPQNPLGERAMRLDIPGYLIHGTNRPAGVGMRVTHGCLRMFPEDIEYLFEQIAVDTTVRIINDPVKIGWQGEELVMEVHPVLASAPKTTADEPQREMDAAGEDLIEPTSAEELLEQYPPDELLEVLEKDPLTYATEQFIAATGERPGQLDWMLVEEVVERADGMPIAVGESIKNAATSAAFE